MYGKIPFFVASNEGSILISCATSLALSLIKPHEKLDRPPPEGNRNVLYSSADEIKKKDESRLKVHMLVQKNKLKTSTENISDVCSREEQSVTSSSREQFQDGSSNKQSNTTCTRNIKNKNCQAEKGDIWPKKPQIDVWSKKPASRSNTNKKLIGLANDKKCQATTCDKKQKKFEYDEFKCVSDRKCQAK